TADRCSILYFHCASNFNLIVTGKSWWVSMLFLRLLVVLLAGFTLFTDEQDRFICNTIHPGCSNICFDVYAPVSVLHFWLFHLLLLCLPHILFATYITHKVLSYPHFGCEWRTPRFYCFYFLVVILRILVETVFGIGQFFIFGLSIPKSFLCYEAPCKSGVECYISKPTEKTLMLISMLGVSSLSILLSLADLVSSVKAMLMEEMSKGEQSSVLTVTATSEGSEALARLAGSSKDAVKDEKPPVGVSARTTIHTGESAQDQRTESKDLKVEITRFPSPMSTPVPTHFVLHSQLKPKLSTHLERGRSLNPRVPTPLGAPAATNPGQESHNTESQDKRAWV
uniref:Gap junction protein n=1 Tax=Mastacembelus armatus TaxID=205130 RepID=A0A3Q3S6A8_9TELE